MKDGEQVLNQIYTLTGKLLREGSIRKGEEIDFRQLTPGAYLESAAALKKSVHSKFIVR
ncbi:MAG: T9SS type A sorting domain-containing protein [Owenweeksia sp.]|nr:T9SS type A sorting domain-containing protein [Owenweeksia sp.]